jgi:hypothetical protein
MTIPALFRPALIIAIAALFITACGTKSIAEWQDAGFSGPIDNILIIGASDQPTLRRLFEDTFVQELAAIKIRAIPSYSVISTDRILSRESVEAVVKDQALASTLVTRLLGVEEGVIYRPPTYYAHHNNYYNYYANAMVYSSPGYYDKYQIFTLESNLYDTATQKLVWSMQSESIDPSTPRKVIEEQIRLTINTLSERGLIRAKP